jgi:hypothetical protein
MLKRQVALFKGQSCPYELCRTSRELVATNHKPNAQAAAAHESLMCDALPRAQVPTAALQKYFSAVAWAVRSSKETVFLIT